MRVKKWPALVKKFAGIVFLSISVSNCAWFGEDEAEKQQRKEETLYRSAKTALQQGNYVEALESYKQFESSFPFSPYAPQAAVEKAYLHYKNHHYEEAIGVLDQFIKVNPDYSHLDYVYYLKGLAHYNYARGTLSRLLKRDRTDKDPTPLQEGFFTFTELVKKYPDSRYATDARSRSIMLRNMLAAHEVRIADYYMRRRAYPAVINRCNYVLENYPEARHTPEVLWLLAEAYRRVGSPELERDTRRVMELNYPGFARTIGADGKARESTGQGALKDLSDTILEILRIKPRY